VAKYWQYRQVKIQLGPEPWIFNADSDHFGYPGSDLLHHHAVSLKLNSSFTLRCAHHRYQLDA